MVQKVALELHTPARSVLSTSEGPGGDVLGLSHDILLVPYTDYSVGSPWEEALRSKMGELESGRKLHREKWLRTQLGTRSMRLKINGAMLHLQQSESLPRARARGDHSCAVPWRWRWLN